VSKRGTGGAGVAPVAQVLQKSLTNLGLLKKMRRYQVFSVWPKVVGDIARHAKPRRLAGDVLYVATASSAWSQELTFMRQSILDKLKTALQGEYVREIRFSEHLWDPTELENGTAVDLPLMAKGEGEAAMDAIPDRQLAHYAKRFCSIMARRKVYLLRKGYVRCARCGCLYPSAKRECPFCAVEREWRARRRAIAILEKAPHLPDEEVQSLIGSVCLEPVRSARRELESRCLTIARSALNADGKWAAVDRNEITGAIEKMAALRSLKPAADMTAHEIEKAVGKRLFLAAKRGSQWSRGSSWARKT
jgi:hypothetical protein